MVLDSNILIYAAEPDGAFLSRWVEHPEACIASVSRSEVLGFPRWHLLEAGLQTRIEALVVSLLTLPLDEVVEKRAIGLRRQIKISLADAIVAATALEHGGELVTRNVADFQPTFRSSKV